MKKRGNTTYELELSAEDIFKACDELDKFSQKLQKARIKLLNRLADYAIEVIRQNCPVDTEQLINSIQKSEIFENTIEVYTDNAYAQFVEFGTGIVGKNNPHPDAGEFGWQYDVNEHGIAGWKYQGEDGQWHWTQGQESSKFMYLAFQDLEQNYMRIGEEVFKEEGLI